MLKPKDFTSRRTAKAARVGALLLATTVATGKGCRQLLSAKRAKKRLAFKLASKAALGAYVVAKCSTKHRKRLAEAN